MKGKKMPFDESKEDHGGGGDDPAHDEEGIKAVANNVVMGLVVLSQSNGLCTRCTGLTTVGLIVSKIASADPEDNEVKVEIMRHVAASMGMVMIEREEK
jgi:hypothetical protein